jgi:hypothetical protein
LIISVDSGQKLNIAVTLSVRSAQNTILLSQSGLTFNVSAQGASPLAQSFGILNIGQGSMNWAASATTLGSPSGWLSVDQTTGTVAQAFTDVSFVNVTVDPSKFRTAGIYYGQVQVTSGTADNSPQSVSIVVNVLAPRVSPGPEIRPSALVFAGPAGSILQEQDIVIAEPQADTFISGIVSDSQSGPPFRYNPATAAIQPGSPATIHFYPDLGGLSPGSVSRSTITLQFKSGVARTISVLAVVGQNGPQPAAEAVAPSPTYV